MGAIGLALPLSAHAGLVINFHDANQGYAYYGGYNTLMYGQGAAPDLGNNVWNGFGDYGGPGSTDFYGGGNTNSGHGSVPNNLVGNPYAWHSGTSASGTQLFSPTNSGASNVGNAYSNGTISPITLSLSYVGDNGSTSGVSQGSPNKIFSETAVANNGVIGTFSLGGVPTTTGVTYDLYLYGANYNGDRGATFNVSTSSFTAVGGYTATMNPGGGPLNSYVLGQDYVEFTNITPTTAGVIAGTWSAVSNTTTGQTGEGDFNGLQLVSVSPTIVYTGTGTPPAVWDTGTDMNFASGGTPVSFVNGDAVTFDDTATGPTSVTVAAGGVSPSSITFNNSSMSYTISGGPITGAATLTLTGTGTVTLNSSNTYTGATSVQAGTLTLNAGASVASAAVGVSSGAVLNLEAGTSNLSAGSLTGSALSVINNGTINLYSSNNLGSLSGSGTVNLLASPSALTLTGGSFSGTYSASGSTLILGGSGGTFAAVINDGGSANSVVVNSTGIWILGGNNGYTGGTNVSAGVASAGSASPFGTGNVVLAGGSLGASYIAGTAEVPGVVSGGALVLAAAGRGVLELTGSNTYTGPVTIDGSSGSNFGGTLKIDSQSGLGAATSITVQSGGSFEVNGSFGTGDTAFITGPGMISTYGAPLPNGPTGALRGADGTSSTWAGSVNVSGGANIQPGADGTFVLTGSISGTGGVTFAFNSDDNNGATIVLAPGAGQSNTYTGETTFIPDGNVNTTNPSELQLGQNNGISPNSGLNIVAGSTPEAVDVDLEGFSQSLKYLSGGAQEGYQIQNSGSSTSTLKITSGIRSGVAANFGGVITGNIAVVMNDPTGTGYQILSGANTYSGGTTIIDGTLAAGSSGAFSNTPVTLKGGTLGLAPTITGTTPILTPSSFSSFKLNNGSGDPASVSGTTIEITDGTNSVSNSAFYPTPVTVSDKLGFTAHFTYDIVSGESDGITFCVQNDPLGASAYSAANSYEIGYGGIPLGQRAITNSAAVAFEIYTPNTHNNAGWGTAFTSGGYTPGESGSPATAYIVPTVDLFTQAVDVNLVYNGPAQTLTETIVGDTDGTSDTIVYTGIDYSALVGGAAGGSTTAYVGFTGGSGGVAAEQTISNFTYSTNLTSPQSIANEVDATTPGTTSSIQLGISPGGGNLTSKGSVGLINISSGAIVTVTVSAGAGTNRGVLSASAVSITTGGKLDLGSNDLDIASGGNTIAQVFALVATGYNGGNWNGSGIASSAAAADTTHLTALGVIINDTTANTTGSNSGTPLYTTLDGATVADGDILVKYTYYGDANLDGKVDGTDYSRIDNGYLLGLSGWANGDFNYDGVINGSDYTLIDNAFNTQGASLSEAAAQVASPTAQIAGTSAVPEPASLGFIAFAAVGLLGRRRRQQ